MNIQSLSIAVPAGCPNKCQFCVARMNHEDYVNQIEENMRFRDLYKRDYKDRLAFARDNGCNSLMFSGNGEALMNRRFMEMVSDLNDGLDKPFRILELQTSGVTLDDEVLRWLRNTIKVSTISLSLSSLSSDKNQEYNATPEKVKVDIKHLCSEIKRYDFNLRISLNMTDDFNGVNIADLFQQLKALGADQVTFRKLYTSGQDTPQDRWIGQHAVEGSFWPNLNRYVAEKGRKLERLPFGAIRYSVHEISAVVDDDCMSTDTKEDIKYLVLRQNCKLYTKWDDKGSLLF
jgi:molybdenum cofactor biosynthesis enzyme MoaA